MGDVDRLSELAMRGVSLLANRTLSTGAGVPGGIRRRIVVESHPA